MTEKKKKGPDAGLMLDDFLSFNYLSCVRLSPDGNEVAYICTTADIAADGYTADLYSTNRLLKGHANVRLTEGGRVKSFAWASPKVLLYTEQDAPSVDFPIGRTRLYSADIYSDARELIAAPEGLMTLEGVLDSSVPVLSRTDDIAHEAVLAGLKGEARLERLRQLIREDETVTVLDEYPFWHNGRGVTAKKRKALYLYAADGLRRVTPPGFRTDKVAVRGERILYSGVFVDPIESYMTGAYLYDAAEDTTVCVQRPGECHIYDLELWNGDAVLVSSDLSRYSVSQCQDVTLIAADGRTRTALLTADDEVSYGNPVCTDSRLGGGYLLRASGEWLYMISGRAEKSVLVRLDRGGRLETVFEGTGSVDCFDVHGGTVLMAAMQDMRLPELYLLSGGRFTRMTSWNDDFYLCRPPVVPDPISFTDRDGYEIHGLVYRPAGIKKGQSCPVILDIHGGPHLSYGPVYVHEMQYWAAHGYFVICCNPRGSDGRGNDFGYLKGRFGEIDYEDLMAFCDEVLRRYPEMDKDRMGVTGGSYGGYMTNWIIGHTDRFAAAASQRGLSNFVSMEGTSDIGRLFVTMQVGASTHTDLEKMWYHSPLKYADRCKTPTLFIHADQDLRSYMVEALQMYTALINNGVPTRLCLFHNENHDLSRQGRPRSRIRRLEEITEWMDRYLGVREARDERA